MGFLKPVLLAAMLFSGIASAHESDLRMVEGLKYPNSEDEGTAPVAAAAWSVAHSGMAPLPGFTDLLPYVMRAPNQQDAGSCLYMSLTGIAEWWLAKLNPRVSRAPGGPLDLSERYLMNFAGVEENENGVANWKIDSVYLFNRARSIPLNRDYRFTKNWYAKNARGSYVPALANSPGAQYSTTYNWINQMSKADPAKFRPLPRFERDVLFADPESNQWNVGVMPQDIVERIKSALVRRRAPVHVIYNHMGYWHAVYIMGFDDNADSKDCAFVRRFMDMTAKKVNDLRDQLSRARDPKEVTRIRKALTKAEGEDRKITSAYSQGGGCRSKGMFYVRDSIYGEEQSPVYDYDLARVGDEAPYSKSIILHEYDWIKYLGNHATQIYLAH